MQFSNLIFQTNVPLYSTREKECVYPRSFQKPYVLRDARVVDNVFQDLFTRNDSLSIDHICLAHLRRSDEQWNKGGPRAVGYREPSFPREKARGEGRGERKGEKRRTHGELQLGRLASNLRLARSQ